MVEIIPVILCGGSGTRLWPRSRKALPKPFLPLVEERTLFEATLGRCAGDDLFGTPVVVAGEAHLAHVLDQSRICPRVSVIVEPEARNTAAAIALAAARLPAEAIMLVCPSDHHIADEASFRQAAAAAAILAGEDWMVAFGIAATAPETGYGYILKGDELPGGYRVARFVEKPDLETAAAFVADGNYSWNGGIFAFRAGAFLAELARQRPALHQAILAAVSSGCDDGVCFHPDAAEFAKIHSESVDYAIMENTDRAAMVPVSMGWSDIGNWQALHDARAGDAQGNSTRGERIELVACRNVLAETDGPRISVIGLENIAVVVNGDEVLITSMAGAQLVGKLGGAANQ